MATINKATDHDRDLTVLTVTGAFSTIDALEGMMRFYDDGPTRDLIWDLCSADLAAFDTDGFKPIIAYAESQASRRPNGRSALVGSDDTTFGLARMYEILSEVNEHPIIHATFRSIEDAHNWLAQTPTTNPTT